MKRDWKIFLSFLVTITLVATSTAASIPDLPTNEELHVNIIGEPDVPDQPHSIVNSMCVVVWELTDGLNWFLGHVLEETVEMNYRIDHVEHSPDAQNVFWKYPAVPDVQIVSKKQILPCKIDGDWDYGRCTETWRNIKFHLKNSTEVHNMYIKLVTE